MKLLITNPDSIVNPNTGKYYDGIIEVLDEFNSFEDRGIVVISYHSKKLSNIPPEYNPLKVTARQRRGTSLVNYIESQLNIKSSGLIVLGTKDDDVYLAANSQILLLRANYTQFITPEAKLFRKEYGVLGIIDATHLGLVLSKFREVQSPWYYSLEIDSITTLYCLTNANTMGYREEDAIKLANEFKTLLKQGQMNHFDSFALFFMISVYSMFENFKDIDYWSIYPSSDGSRDVDLDGFATKMRESFKKRFVGEILYRHTPVPKRRFTKDVSYEDIILSQIDSISSNSDIDLNGKCVCIIDDFSTNGTSCEATRHILKQRGVRKIVFIALGKFGRHYHKLEFGKPKNKITTLEGAINGYADVEFVKSLKDLM